MSTRRIVDEKTHTSKDKQKKYYDKKTKVVELSIGDQVLVRRKAFDGKHKIEDRFETDLYMIVDQHRRDMPVYRVRSAEKERTLHRNLIVLVENQDIDSEEVEDDGKVIAIINKKKRATSRLRKRLIVMMVMNL